MPAFPTPVRQVVSYPIVHDNSVRGALILMGEQGPGSVELYRVFAVQCALVLKFSSHIEELEKMRRLEEQVYRSHKMEAVGQLAGGIAHDFNNTLSGVSGYAQLIKRKFSTDVPELKEYVDAIIAAARRSADLTEKLLAFARKGKLQIVPVDMHQIIQEALQILQPTIDKRIQITCKLDARPSVVLADPTQLQNVLINLAINGRNAMPGGGELTLKTEVVTYNAPQWVDGEYEVHPGTYLVTSVIDTGIGMDRQTQRRIFEPFFTTDTTGKGSGLGLASVYGTVKAHNGVVSVQSAPGKGSTFRLYLPLAKTAADAPPPSDRRIKTEQLVRGHGHILVVDDEEMICHLSKEMLTFLGYTVTACQSGAEAVEYFAAHAAQVDIVILDIMMPKMDGYETFHELSRIKPDVKALMTTGYALPRDTRHMAALGLCGFIQKPFESGKLSQMLYDTLHGKAPGAPQK
jgi:signal transduction histidine kinase/ActR/RegA family two-component response regulator